jgi:FHS family glucose/mannose:H+ symporter-like MFS transporter
MNRLITIACASYLLTGFTHVILGAVLTEMLEHYGRSYNDGGVLIFTQFFGFLSGVLCMPYFSRRFGRRTSVTTAFVILCLAEISIGLLPVWSVTVGLALLVGFAFGVIEAGIGTFILIAAKEKQAIAMSKLEVAFGIGALLLPLISSFLIANGVWVYAFWILGLSALMLAFVWSKLSFGSSIDALLVYKEDQNSPKQARPVYTKGMLPVLFLFMFIFFLYVGLETTIINFLPSVFMEKMQADSASGALTVTAFWLTMVIGRLFAGVIAEKLNYFRFLAYSCIGGLVVLIGFALNTTIWGGFTLVLLLGLFMAGIFAVALIFANQLLPGMTERTTSLLIASGGMGGALLPLGIGWAMDHFRVEVTLWFFAGAMLLSLLLITYSRRWKVLPKSS